MALTRRQWGIDPLAELEEMSNRINRLFGRVGMMPAATEGREALALAEWSPTVNVSETDDSFRITAELPGVKKADVHVTLEQGVLTIRGERRREEEKKGERFHRVESYYGSFMRRFTLPETADVQKVDGRFEDGVLTVTIGKTEARKTETKEVQIQ